MPWSRHVVAAVAVVNGLSAVQTVGTISGQIALGVSYPPLIRGAASAIWTVVFAALTVGLFRRSVRVLRLVAPLLTIYGLWALLSLLVFARADFDRGRAVFQAVFTLAVLIPFWWWHFRVAVRAPSPE